MAVILRGGAIFLHVPKTGGSWVTAALEEQGLVQKQICHIHADAHQVLRYLSPARTVLNELTAHLKPNIPLPIKQKLSPDRKLRSALWQAEIREVDTTPFIFCFVRHPIGWYESMWRYMYQHDWPMFGLQYDIHRWHPTAVLNGLGNPDFNKFIENIIAKRPGFVSEMYGWYTTPVVDFVGKQENLAEDLAYVLRKTGVHADEDRLLGFPPVNRTRDSSYLPTPKWDGDLRAEILRLEYPALKRYGYVNHPLSQ